MTPPGRPPIGRYPLLLVVAATLVGCDRPTAPSPASPHPDAVAVVDGRPLSRAYVEAELQRTGRGRTPEDLAKFVDELVQREQLIARARQLGLDNDAGVRRAWESAMIARLKELHLEPRLTQAPTNDIPPTPRSTEHTASTNVPIEIRLAVLRLDATPKTSAEKLDRLRARLEEARSRTAQLPSDTVGFGALAMEYSDDAATRLRGGDLGWMEPNPSRYRLDSRVMAAALELKSPGDVSPVVRGDDGLYLVRLSGRRPAKGRPDQLQQEEALARHRQHVERRRAIEAAFLEETRTSFPATLNTGVVASLSAALAPASAEPDAPLQSRP